MSQVEVMSAKEFEGGSDVDEDRYKDIIMKSKYSHIKDFNVDDYEVFDEDFIEVKAREYLENYIDEYMERLREEAEEGCILDFISSDV